MTSERRREFERPYVDELMVTLRSCLSNRIELDALVLFGSRATDEAFDESDLDFAVISGDFRGLDPLERGRRVDCRLSYVPGLDFVHLTPEELREPRHSYLRCAILEEGRAVVDRGVFAEAKRVYEELKAAGKIVFRGPVVEFH